MEDGEVGLLGQLVAVIVRNPDIEDVIIRLPQMEDLIVMETIRMKRTVLEEDV